MNFNYYACNFMANNLRNFFFIMSAIEEQLDCTAPQDRVVRKVITKMAPITFTFEIKSRK